MPCDTMRWCAVRCDAMLCGAMRWYAKRCNVMLCVVRDFFFFLFFPSSIFELPYGACLALFTFLHEVAKGRSKVSRREKKKGLLDLHTRSRLAYKKCTLYLSCQIFRSLPVILLA